MSKGNQIIVTSNPQGRFLEGVISGTPKPGTVMQIVSGTAAVGGRHTWQVYNRDADGNRPKGPLAVLLEDSYQGKTVDDAYVTGTRGFLYVPQPGEELNMLFENQSGTADAFAVGDMAIVDDGTGKLIATTGSPENEPFVVLEAVAALTVDTLIWCQYSGF